MLLECSRAASGKVTLSRNLAKVTLPEAALLSSNSILKVIFLGHPVFVLIISLSLMVDDTLTT